MTRYDAIGQGYSAYRQEDPYFRERIRAALGDARSVVNVGAGTGNYEPEDRPVVAVEPSDVMSLQRPAHRVPAVRATADDLPLADHSVDAAMALITVHHWDDGLRAGIAEMCRVARRRVVIFTYEPDVSARMWLVAEYMPEIAELDRRTFPTCARLEQWLPGDVRTETVPYPRDSPDRMFGSFWAHPERVLDAEARAATSGFARSDPEVVDRVVRTLEADLGSGRWAREHAELTERDRYDAGLRLVVAEL